MQRGKGLHPDESIGKHNFQIATLYVGTIKTRDCIVYNYIEHICLLNDGKHSQGSQQRYLEYTNIHIYKLKM